MDTEASLEDSVLRQIDIEILQKTVQSLTEVQKERLHLNFLRKRLPEKLLTKWRILRMLFGKIFKEL
jgi:hypothetical protein